MTAGPDLSLVIPVINEEKAIGGVLGAVRRQAERLGISMEAIVVDGASTDGTVRAAEAAGAKVVVELGGYAASVRAGFSAASGEYILTMDGDGSHSAEEFPPMWERRSGAELVVGSRFVDGGGMDLPLYRRLLTMALNRTFRLLMGLPVSDTSSGFRLYRAAAVKGLGGESKTFDFQQETLISIHRSGGRVCEVPIRYVWRTAGESKARIPKLALGYLRLLWRFGLG